MAELFHANPSTTREAEKYLMFPGGRITREEHQRIRNGRSSQVYEARRHRSENDVRLSSPVGKMAKSVFGANGENGVRVVENAGESSVKGAGRVLKKSVSMLS